MEDLVEREEEGGEDGGGGAAPATAGLPLSPGKGLLAS